MKTVKCKNCGREQSPRRTISKKFCTSKCFMEYENNRAAKLDNRDVPWDTEDEYKRIVAYNADKRWF